MFQVHHITINTMLNQQAENNKHKSNKEKKKLSNRKV